MPPPKAKLIGVAMSPTIVTAPGFLIHQAASMSKANPIVSQRNGMPVAAKNMGANSAFSTPQRAPQIAIAATSRVLRYVSSSPPTVLLFF
jgi:hypothetical protein